MFKDSDKKISRLTLKNILFIITFTLILIWVLLHMSDVVGSVLSIITMCRPFLYGIMIAFVFNLPLKFFLAKLPSSMGKWRKLVAALLSVALILVIIAFIFSIVVPQVVDSVASLAVQLPGYVDSAAKMLDNVIKNYDIPKEVFVEVNKFTNNI